MEELNKMFPTGFIRDPKYSGNGGSPGIKLGKPTPRRSSKEVIESIRNAKKNRTRTKRESECEGGCCYVEFDAREHYHECAHMYVNREWEW
jgi:hypothetical protein